MTFGAVAIGRNEGERLRRCLQSLTACASVVIYVDSGSTDGSSEWARKTGVDLVDLDMRLPFTAARARNAGFKRLRKIAPDLDYVLFVDGDCELISGWYERASSFLDLHADIAAVCGRRRERYPDHSIYNWLCDRGWDGPAGEVRAIGGDAMVRATAIESVGLYREDLIAGEEPELCVRLRAAGWRIWRLPDEMTLHDAAMVRFSQWWRRAIRTGYAFAQGAYLHGAPPERHWVWESRRAWIWGIGLPFVCLVASLLFPRWGWAVWLIFPLQIFRQTLRNQGSLSERAWLGLFQMLARFAEGLGQVKFLCDRLLRRQAPLVEYK